MKAIPIIACLFLVLGMFLAFTDKSLSPEPSLSMIFGSGSSFPDYFVSIISLYTAAVWASVWSVLMLIRRSRKALITSCVGVILAAVSAVLIWSSFGDHKHWKEMGQQVYINELLAEKVYEHRPPVMAIVTGLLSAIMMGVSLSQEVGRLRKIKEDDFANSKFADEFRTRRKK